MRKLFKFWLNDQRSEDWQLYDLIQQLKKPTQGQGQFTRAVREGIRLWVDLQAGRLDVLLELFPWVKEALDKSATAQNGAGGSDDISAKLDLILASQKSNNGYQMQSTGKPIASANIAMPNFEDDDLPALKLSKDTHTDVGINFLKSMGGMND